MNREKYEENLRKEGSNNFAMYERGRDVEKFPGTKEDLEKLLGKPARLICVKGVADKDGFVEHIHKRYQFIGRQRTDYMVEYQDAYDKRGNLIKKGILVKVE